MEILRADAIITAAWDQVFGRELIKDSWETQVGLLFEVEVNVQNFGYERDGNTPRPEWAREFYRSLLIVVTARHEVFVHSSTKANQALREVGHLTQGWVNTSNHDSCWRSDGLRLIWETLAEGYEQCWGHVPTDHRVTMNSMHRWCTVNTGPFSRGLIQLVHAPTENDPTREGWRRLADLRKLEFNLTVKEAQTKEHAAA